MSKVSRSSWLHVLAGACLGSACCSRGLHETSSSERIPSAPAAMTAGQPESAAGRGGSEAASSTQPSAAGSAGGREPVAAPNGGAGAAATVEAGRAGAGSSAVTAGSAAGSGGVLFAGSGGAMPSAAFALTAVGAAVLGADEVAFPANALPPMNQSPEFEWSGVPAGAKSLALVFSDVSGGAVKWVVWDIATSASRLPPGISAEANPSEVPGSSQIGSLGNQGYAGPCCSGNRYEFVLWAIDVEKLPGAQRLSTYQLRDLISEHDVAATPPVKMRIMRQ